MVAVVVCWFLTFYKLLVDEIQNLFLAFIFPTHCCACEYIRDSLPGTAPCWEWSDKRFVWLGEDSASGLPVSMWSALKFEVQGFALQVWSRCLLLPPTLWKKLQLLAFVHHAAFCVCVGEKQLKMKIQRGHGTERLDGRWYCPKTLQLLNCTLVCVYNQINCKAVFFIYNATFFALYKSRKLLFFFPSWAEQLLVKREQGWKNVCSCTVLTGWEIPDIYRQVRPGPVVLSSVSGTESAVSLVQ